MAKIAFLQKTCWDFIGVMSMSATLKASGHRCDVFIESEEKSLARCIADFRPDIVAFSVTTNDYYWSLELARQIKNSHDATIVFGGIHPTIFPEIITEHPIDMICRGEGEHAILDIADAVDQKRDCSTIMNLWVKKSGEIIRNPIRPLIRNLDELPPFDRELYYKYPSIKNYPARNFMITRGCPYSCSFCFNHQFNKLYRLQGSPVRRKSIENSIAELKRLKQYKTRMIVFWDDTFTLDKEWLFNFLTAYRKEIALPFYCNARVDHLDRETVMSLKSAGACTVDFGIETGNEERRKALLKKDVTNLQIVRAAKLLHEFGIRINAENMLALPGETIESALETLELNRRIQPTYAWCSIFQPYARLSLTDEAIKRGLITEGLRGSDRFTYYEKSVLDIPCIEEISNLQKLFNVAVKFRLQNHVIRFLIRLPLRRVYLVVFIVFYGIGIRKIFNLRYTNLLAKGIVMFKSYFRR